MKHALRSSAATAIIAKCDASELYSWLSYSSTYKNVNKTQRVHQNASQMSFLPLDGIFMKTDCLIKQSPGVSVRMSLSTVLDEWVTPVICWTSLLVSCHGFWLAVVHQLTQIYLSPLWSLFLVHVWTPPPPLKYESFSEMINLSWSSLL